MVPLTIREKRITGRKNTNHTNKTKKKGKEMKKLKKALAVTVLSMSITTSMGIVTWADTTNGITSQQAQYSNRWETQVDGSWKYKLDNGNYATSAWVQDEVDGQWYLLDGAGVMRSGLFESYGRYYLLSEVHDGHFGHLVKNGEVYKGITIQADTSADYEGALLNETIESLKANGYNFGSVSSVTGTQHVTNGQITSADVQTPESTGKSAIEIAHEQFLRDTGGSTGNGAQDCAPEDRYYGTLNH